MRQTTREQAFATGRLTVFAGGRGQGGFVRRPLLWFLCAIAGVGLWAARYMPLSATDAPEQRVAAGAPSAASAELRRLEDRFTPLAGQPVVYLDRDALDVQQGLAPWWGRRPDRARALADQVFRRGGRVITGDLAANLAAELDRGDGGIARLDAGPEFHARLTGGRGVCLVLPPPADDSAAEALSRLIAGNGWQARMAGDAGAALPGRFAALSAGFACALAQRPDQLPLGTDMAWRDHLARAAADAAAILVLRREGLPPDAIEMLARARAAWSMLAGPARAAEAGWESRLAGVIHYTSPALRAAAALPTAELAGLDDAAILARAQALAQSAALPEAGFRAIANFHAMAAREGADAIRADLLAAARGPAAQALAAYLADTDQALDLIHLAGAEPPAPATAYDNAAALEEVQALFNAAAGRGPALLAQALAARRDALRARLKAGDGRAAPRLAALSRLARQGHMLLRDDFAPTACAGGGPCWKPGA